MKQFPDNSRVCFVGDSITHIGLFIKHIAAYYRERLPERRIEFYNCGIAGGNLTNTLRVYDEDVAIYEPTHIVLMIGVNDSRRNRLIEPAGEERYAKLLEAYEKYRRNLESLYQLTQKQGVELILCTPMPYAEYQKSDVQTLPGGFALIQSYAELVRSFAREHELALCDYHKAATRAMQREVIYAPDRVHPNPRGHALMAQAFLSELGIEYEIPEVFSAEVEEWYALTQTLRNIITTEFLTVPDYFSLTDVELLEVIREKHEGMLRGTYEADTYVGSLIRAYVTDKPRQAEYIQSVKGFFQKI